MHALDHPDDIVEDISVPKANDPVAVLAEFTRAAGIGLLLGRVLPAIKLNRDFSGRAGEIDDIRSDRMLSPEAVLGQKLPQRTP